MQVNQSKPNQIKIWKLFIITFTTEQDTVSSEENDRFHLQKKNTVVAYDFVGHGQGSCKVSHEALNIAKKSETTRRHWTVS